MFFDCVAYIVVQYLVTFDCVVWNRFYSLLLFYVICTASFAQRRFARTNGVGIIRKVLGSYTPNIIFNNSNSDSTEDTDRWKESDDEDDDRDEEEGATGAVHSTSNSMNSPSQSTKALGEAQSSGNNTSNRALTSSIELTRDN